MRWKFRGEEPNENFSGVQQPALSSKTVCEFKDRLLKTIQRRKENNGKENRKPEAPEKPCQENSPLCRGNLGKERHKRRGTLCMVAHPEPRIWETEARR